MQLSILSVCLLATFVSAEFPTTYQAPLQQPRSFGPEQPLNVPTQYNWQQNQQYQQGCPPMGLRAGEVEIPREYLQAHHRFTSDLLKHPGFWTNIHKHGVASSNSFTLGHLLAVISQEIFDLPTTNIPRLLRLPTKEKVVDSYASQFHTFEDEDNKVYPTSYLFTPYDQLQGSPALHRLFSRQLITSLWKNPHAPALINEIVHAATRDNIEDELVPDVPPFHEQTAGVFLNTFHYGSDWKYDWTKVGKQNFNTPNGPVPIETYEFNGAFPVVETRQYTAVGVPLEGDTKWVVFVQPNGDVKDYFAQGTVDEIFTSGPHTWPKKNVRVQVPHVNFTVAHPFGQLDEEKLQCIVEGGAKPHLLQPIVQVVSFSMNHEEIEYSVATGAQVNQGGRSSSFRHLSQQPQRPFAPTPFVQGTNVPGRINTLNTNYNAYTSAEHVFDRPFFVYIHDETLGPFGFHALSHNFHDEEQQRQARHHESPYSFQEQSKTHRWNCQQ